MLMQHFGVTNEEYYEVDIGYPTSSPGRFSLALEVIRP